MNMEEILTILLQQHGIPNVDIQLSKKAVNDLSNYDKNTQEKIIALLIKRAQSGPLLKPKGIGEPLHKPLQSFTKIKPKAMGLRIVYRPVEGGFIRMEVIAIGPRDKKEVYKMAASRLMDFFEEMGK